MITQDIVHLLSRYVLPLGGLCLALLGWTISRTLSPFHRLPYPPGPPEKGFLSGNFSDLPKSHAWLTYFQWGKEFGDIIHFRIYNKHAIILNVYEDNMELLDKRSALFSDRFMVPMIKLMGWPEFGAPFMGYGPVWRSHRKIYQQIFKPDAALNYRPAQTRKIHDLLYGLLTTPEDFMDHYRTLTAAIIMSVMYAHDISPKHDYFVDLAEEAISRVSLVGFNGAALVNAFPFLRFIPTWFPGAGFKRAALEARRLAFQMRDVPIAAVQKQIKEGMAPNCAVADLLETCNTSEDFERIAGVAGTSYAAGADTTLSALGTFFYAMCLHPEIQRKAQKAIDTVAGSSNRLITYDDKPGLRYIEAVYREVLRWRPVAPLSIPHTSSEEDVYKGYYIPKGAMIIPNIWAISRDPKRYPDPDRFNPDRFLNEGGELIDDNCEYVFGFGRRLCPGRHFASSTLWLTFATVLQTLDIRPKQDMNGNEIPLDTKYSDGMVSHVLKYECSITPRCGDSRKLILETVGKEYQ